MRFAHASVIKITLAAIIKVNKIRQLNFKWVHLHKNERKVPLRNNALILKKMKNERLDQEMKNEVQFIHVLC